MSILAIETSCDDTCAAVTDQWHVHSNAIRAQDHSCFGGVFPTVARSQHREALPQVVKQACAEAGIALESVDAVAVTQGPGLAPSLEEGILFARSLASEYEKPLIPVNHVEGHVWSVLARPKGAPTPTPHLPALSLIVSGGHTEFILVLDKGLYRRLGWTLDDAAGEALDKFGREIGLSYPAGKTIEQLACHGNPHQFSFPLPMTQRHDYHLSFAGLKTASKNLVADLRVSEPHTPLPVPIIADLCASFQHAVFRHICYKMQRVLEDFPEIRSVWIGGGVAANKQLYQHIQATCQAQKNTLEILAPCEISFCRDNAAMIGCVAAWNRPTTQIERRPQWSVDTITHQLPELRVFSDILEE